jgi:hypothetical protein
MEEPVASTSSWPKAAWPANLKKMVSEGIEKQGIKV